MTRTPSMPRRRTTALLLGVCLLGGLLASAPAAADVTSPDTPPPAWSAVPVPAGRVEAAVAQLDGLVTGLLDRTGLPGLAVAVVHNDRMIYAKGFGVRNTTTGAPVDENTVFQLASLSKPLGASVVAAAVGRGSASWDDPIRDHLPWFRMSDPYVSRNVTIADMYAHRSGLAEHAGDSLEDLGYDRAEVLRRLRFQPLTPFRTEYAYTNFGMTAAGEAVAVANDTTWERLSRALVYRPLGMTSTSSTFADYRARTNRADGHVQAADGTWVPRYVRDADAQSPAGGASSSVVDMARWMRMELNGGVFEGRPVVDPDALAAALTPHMITRPVVPVTFRPGGYGYGMDLGVDGTGRTRMTHSGAFALGVGTAFTMLPSENLGIVTLGNGAAIGVPEALNAAFMDLVETGGIVRDWFATYNPLFVELAKNKSRLAGRTRPSDPRPALASSAYTGTYANDYYGPARVVVRGDRLVLELGPTPVRFRLSHWNRNTFTYLPRGENATGIAAVDFRVRQGRAVSMTIENLEPQLNVFQR